MAATPTAMPAARAIASLWLLLALLGCSKNHTEVDLASARLQDSSAGFWLRDFDLQYGPGSEPTKNQIVQKLRANGQLLDRYTHRENANDVTTFVWHYRGNTYLEQYYQGGAWQGPKVFPPQEYYEGGPIVWITLDLGTGFPYAKMLPDHYQLVEEQDDGAREHKATIKSASDKARLFLFGHGRCKRISLF